MTTRLIAARPLTLALLAVVTVGACGRKQQPAPAPEPVPQFPFSCVKVSVPLNEPEEALTVGVKPNPMNTSVDIIAIRICVILSSSIDFNGPHLMPEFVGGEWDY